MYLRARHAMVVPLPVHEGANGYSIASRLQIGRDLYWAMEKSKVGVENGKQGGHDLVVGWQHDMSESSMSSIDSLLTGEVPYAHSDMNVPLFRKAKLGVTTSESDEDLIPDSLHDDFTSKKTKRQVVGGTASSLNVDEDHGSTPSDDGKDPSSRVKFMCSFGGKIFPRPLDGRLRYVGGDTKIIAVNRDTNYAELMAKMTEVYGQSLTLKYQLPDEDLDALVSVSSDEDLENMMDEYDKLERCDGSTRLRVFLFPAVDYDSSSHHNDLAGDSRNSEQRYVDAVNGISEGVPRNRVDSYSSSVPTFALESLVPMDAPESWGMPRGPDSLPVALLAHDVGSHVHRVPVGVALPSMTSRSSAPSAPSSAPSSPPLLPRPAGGKLPVITDVHLPYHPETHIKTPYNVLLGDGNYQDNESFGGSGASSGSQHDPLYRSSDSRRGPDSPPRRPHDGGHQDHSLWGDQRRLAEMKVPRVSSHGKLTRLVEHVELVPATGESQQVAEMHLLLHQQHQPLHQPVWQHPMDSQQDYRRADLPQSTLAQGYQHQPLVYRSGHPQGLQGHDGVFRQNDQQQQQYQEELIHQLPRSVSSHALASGVPSGASSSYHIGSDPSSPRLGFREVSQRHAPGPQQVPIHWPYAGVSFPEQASYSRRLNYVDPTSRSYRLSNSPPKHRDLSSLADTVRLRNQQQQQQQQQSLGNAESIHHEHVQKTSQIPYDPNPGVQSYDLLSRPQLPLYKGFNPFQETFSPFQDHQESNDARSHQLSQQGIDSQFLSGQKQQLHTLHKSQRIDYQDPLQPVEHPTGKSWHQETQHKVPDHDSDEIRQGFRGRHRARLSDDNLLADPGVSHQRDIHESTYPGLHLPESADDLLSTSMGDFTLNHSKKDRLEHSVSSGFQFRPTMVPPNHPGVYSGVKNWPNLTDSSGLPWYLSRPNEADYLATSGHRAGGIGQDGRPAIYDSSLIQQTPASGPIFEVNGIQHTPAICQGLQFPSVSHRLMDERPTPTAFNPITQQMQNSRLSDQVLSGTDGRWLTGAGPEEVRMEVNAHHLGTFFEGRHQGLPNVRVAKRPSSANIPNLLEDMGEPHVETYTTQCMGNSGMDEGIVRSYAVDGVPAFENSFPTGISTALVNFDTTCVGPPVYHHNPGNTNDLPNIKTISTQVPSVEGDGSGRSTSSTGCMTHSPSHSSCGELSLGHLTMTQHLAEDMASCVLESTPVKASSHVQSKQDNLEAADNLDVWPLETAPTLSTNLWENALDDVTPLIKDDDEPKLKSAQILASIARDDDPEGSLVEPPEIENEGSTVKNASATAADEAIAHGLQTIKNADLEELRELGSGTFGTVYYGKWRGTDVAIKRIKASCFSGRPSEQERMIADFWREAFNLSILHHPNVVAFYGVVSDGPGGTLATVTEYMVNGSLKQVLQKKDRTIDRRKRLLIAMDSAFGMEYLHGKNIVHFDLKCENLLVNMRDPHRPICKVGDLGLSKVKHQTMVSGGVRGTLPWMAPELLNGNSGLVTEKVDIFSFGIVMWELLTGEEPYANMHYGAIIGGIVNNTLRPPIPSWCDPAWRSLMERCWSAEPANRPSFLEIANELRTMSDSLKPKSHPSAQGQ